jgi:hypothetical protein
MIDYVQETDSKIKFPFLGYLEKYTDHGTNYSISWINESDKLSPSLLKPWSIEHEPFDETFGGSDFQQYSFLSEESCITRIAWDEIDNSRNHNLAYNARQLLVMIEEMVSSFKKLKFELGHLPPLHAFNVDDGSILIEWIFKDFRVGFNMEEKPEESGWYLVTTKNLGEISACGSISNVEINKILLWLLNFVITNS